MRKMENNFYTENTYRRQVQHLIKYRLTRANMMHYTTTVKER